MSKSEEKQFSLKQTEINLVGNANLRHNQELLDIFSYVALERLNYPVTQNTQFRTDDKGNLYISERPEEKEEVAVS